VLRAGRAPLPSALRVELQHDGRQGGGEARNLLVSPLSFHVAIMLVAASSQRELLGFLGSSSLKELRRAAATELVGTLCADVLPPGSVDASTVLVLAPALYFRGTWARPFVLSGPFLRRSISPGRNRAPTQIRIRVSVSD